ncbi:response regulator transcription factor [soil metagenome]
MTRVVVVDDHPIFRKGLVALLRASDFDVVGEAENGLEAIEVVAAELPDIVLMDLGLPEMGGIEATARIAAEHPECVVVVITLYDDQRSVEAALEAGASGYVVKQASPDQIIAAINAAAGGALHLGPGVPRPGFGRTHRDVPPAHGLTDRELQIADLVSRGLSNPAIAERLGLSVKTVANYVSLVILKLGATTRQEAASLVRTWRAGN